MQVYETLLKNPKGEFTTSFVRGCDTVKDNRLLPRLEDEGRPRPGPAGLPRSHLPDPATLTDPR